MTALHFMHCKLELPGQQLSNLRSLIAYGSITDTTVLSLVPHCNQLCEIDFGTSQLTSKSQLLCACPQLCSLSNISFRNEALLSNIHRLPRLHTIHDSLGTISQMCTLINAGFRPRLIACSEAEQLTPQEMQTLSLCKNCVTEMRLSVMIDQFAPLFGRQLRSLMCPFSPAIGKCMKLHHLTIDGDVPDNALQQLGSQLIYLKQLRVSTSLSLEQLEYVCCSPDAFADLSTLTLVGYSKTAVALDRLRTLAQAHRPTLTFRTWGVITEPK